MTTTFRHFVAIGLTTALLFGVVERLPEQFVNCDIDHPTTSDMVRFLLTAFLCSAGVSVFAIFPLALVVERFASKRKSSLSKALVISLPFLLTVFSAVCVPASLELSGPFSMLSFIGSAFVCIALAIFSIYWVILWLEHGIVWSRSFGHETST